jgi:DNA-binding CsgD family transcriptional regulator
VTLIGRGVEVRRLHELIDAVRGRGSGGALVVRGEAGIGKTAVLAEAASIARASGLRLLTTAGVESEAHLPYAGLHQLLRPLRNQFTVLPAKQRDALQAALGLAESTVPDAYLVALAVLNLLAEVAQGGPVLVLADDAQWLDPSSAGVLVFLGRRLESEPILLLASARSGTPSRLDEAGLPGFDLGPLPREAAEELLDAGPAGLDAPVRERLLREAAGNPLALTELPIALAHSDSAAILASPWLPLTTRLEAAYKGRFATLPAATRAILEVGALSDSTDLGEAIAAAGAMASPLLPPAVGDVKPALDARLVRIEDSQLVFHHPLVRSAIHQATGTGRRHEVHRALAGLLVGEPDRRAWHLAAASDRPDEDVAAALEAAALRAQRRGSGVDAVAALERAAWLSPNPQRRADRLLRAADRAVELGDPETVARLLDQAAKLDLSDKQRARLAWIRAAFDDGLRNTTTDASTLADLAESVALDGDTELAIKILWSAALRCYWSEPGMAVRDRIVAVAESLPRDPLDARLLFILGYAAPITRGAIVIERSAQLLAHSGLDPLDASFLGSVAVQVGTLDVAIAQSAASLAGLRDEGRLHILGRALGAQSWAAAQLADFAIAVPAAEESARLASETGQPFLLGFAVATQAMIAALRGHVQHAVELAADAERIGTPVSARNVLAIAQHARALAALADGDYAQALARLLRMHDIADASHQLALKYHTVTDLADAAARSERKGDAATALAEMEAAARVTPSPSLHDGLRLARALFAGDDEAEALFQTALAADLSRRPFLRARTELAYGEWLRRQRRAADSKQYLRTARDTFDALGTAPWGERARRELRAAGERSTEPQAVTSDVLTGQELQIAQMAAAGLTNREIGKRLYISHRTVGAHLAKVYAKLGITSRIQLRDALD